MTMIDQQVHRFTRDEYTRMANAGLFNGQRVELLAGEVLDMPPQNEPHVESVSAIGRFLIGHLGKEWQVRMQAPLAVAEDSAPEPDFGVVPTAPPRANAPTSAVLAIEVADSSIARDRRKAGFYAGAGIPEYWIVHVAARRIIQHTGPRVDPRQEGGGRYQTITTLTPTQFLRCTTLPLPAVKVASLLKE